jgi:hypothetical protein
LTVVLSLTVEKKFGNDGEHVLEDLFVRVRRLNRLENFGQGFIDRGGLLGGGLRGLAGAVFLDAAASAKLFDALLLVAVWVAGAVFGVEGLTGAAEVPDCFAEAAAGFCCSLGAAGPKDFLFGNPWGTWGIPDLEEVILVTLIGSRPCSSRSARTSSMSISHGTVPKTALRVFCSERTNE